MKKLFESELIRFILVGGINTLVGYGVFFVLLNYLEVAPYLSNAVGYAVALIFAFILTKGFVFSRSYEKGMILKFSCSFLISFTINQLVLFLSITYLQLMPELSQILAMMVYTLLFFILNKYYVFKEGL